MKTNTPKEMEMRIQRTEGEDDEEYETEDDISEKPIPRNGSSAPSLTRPARRHLPT